MIFLEIAAIFSVVGVIALAGFTAGMAKAGKVREAEADHRFDVVFEWVSKLTEKQTELAEKQTELERRQHCLQEDFEKIPIEEIEDEKLRLERFNDGIMNIMNFGPDVPKLNKEVLKHE